MNENVCFFVLFPVGLVITYVIWTHRQSTCISNSYTLFQSSIMWWEVPVSTLLCIVSGSTLDTEVMFMIQSYSLFILLITESLDFYTPSLLLLCSGCRMSFSGFLLEEFYWWNDSATSPTYSRWVGAHLVCSDAAHKKQLEFVFLFKSDHI